MRLFQTARTVTRVKKTIIGLVGVLLCLASTIASSLSGAPAHAAYSVATYQYAEGYDTCLNLTNAQLSAWWSSPSPNYFVGLYLGGEDGLQSGVGCTGHGAAQWSYAESLGYAIEPFWYGSQMPQSCGDNHTPARPAYISLNTTTAYNEGVDEAGDAARAGSSYGLGGTDVIYLDLEGFTNNSGCLAAAQSYVNGWDYELAVNSIYFPGLYGSSCASYLSNMSSIPNTPTDIAPSDAGVDTTGVYGLQCLPDTKWDHNQRIHQDEVGQDPTVNGVSLYVDEDCADGPVDTNRGANVPNNCRPY